MSKSKIDKPSHVSKLPTKDAEFIQGVAVDDSARADDYMLVYDAVTETLGYESGPAPAAHTIASHSDTTATGAELETLTDGSNADALHSHAGGSGDVVGPGSATDNAIARFDGATGKIIQNCVVLIDDSGNLAIPGTAQLSFSTTGAILYYDSYFRFNTWQTRASGHFYLNVNDKIFGLGANTPDVSLRWYTSGTTKNVLAIGIAAPEAEDEPMAILCKHQDLGTLDITSAIATGEPELRIYDSSASDWVALKVDTLRNLGDFTIDAYDAAAHKTVYILNSDGTYEADLNVERNIIVGGTVDGVDVAAHSAATAAHGVTGAIVGTTDTQTLTNKTITDLVIDDCVGFDAVYDNGNISGAVTINWNNGNMQKATLTGNVTSVTFTDPPKSGTYHLRLAQDGTGGRTVAWGSVASWVDGGTDPVITSTASAVDWLHWMYDKTADVYEGWHAPNFA